MKVIMPTDTSELEPPRPCPICKVAMQATKTPWDKIVYRCDACGTMVTVVEPRAPSDPPADKT